jgi:ABC-type sugar transport system substrate-binding protein
VTKRSTEKRVGEYVVAIWQSDSEFSITYRDLKNNGTIFRVSDGVLKFQDLEDQKVFEVVATVGSDWDADVTKKEYIDKLTKQGKLQVIIPD